MADPSKFTRTYSFTDYQASNPSAPLPGLQVDAELEDVEASIGEIVDAIKDVRRSDGALKNGIVTVDSLDATVAAGVGSGALASAEAAAASADAASDSAVAAASSATAAAGSSTSASGYASDALTSRNEAETERTLAQTARTGAQTARDYANQWATEAEDTLVDDGVNTPGYSAYHWAQVALDAAAGSVADGSITTAKLADGVLSADTTGRAKMADGFVTSAKIADGTIATGDLADGAITSAKIADGTIATGDLADGAVATAKIADGAVSAAKMSTARGEAVTWTAKQTFQNVGLTTNSLDLAVGQIAFPATQNPSANANTLDDYEEGTFTPGFSFGGNAVGIVYTAQTGRYTKIGNRVFFSLRVTISNAGSSTGAMNITGLPFTCSGLDGAVSAGFAQNFSGLTGAFLLLVGVGGTTISVRQSASTGQANVANSNVTNTADIIISGVYETT